MERVETDNMAPVARMEQRDTELKRKKEARKAIEQRLTKIERNVSMIGSGHVEKKEECNKMGVYSVFREENKRRTRGLEK